MQSFFDFLRTICPKCNSIIEAKVKAECSFEEYNLEKSVCITDAQKLVGNVITCNHCNTKFQITGDIPSFKIRLQLEEIK